MANSADPDQLASSEANRSGSTQFAKTRHVVFSKKRVKIRLLDLDFCYKFTYFMANSADPDQLASSEAN